MSGTRRPEDCVCFICGEDLYIEVLLQKRPFWRFDVCDICLRRHIRDELLKKMGVWLDMKRPATGVPVGITHTWPTEHEVELFNRYALPCSNCGGGKLHLNVGIEQTGGKDFVSCEGCRYICLLTSTDVAGMLQQWNSEPRNPLTAVVNDLKARMNALEEKAGGKQDELSHS